MSPPVINCPLLSLQISAIQQFTAFLCVLCFPMSEARWDRSGQNKLYKNCTARGGADGAKTGEGGA